MDKNKNKKQLIIDAAHLAITTAGGPKKLASALTEITGEDISQYRVAKWRLNGIREQYVVEVAELTGIPEDILRPDVFKRPTPAAPEPTQ